MRCSRTAAITPGHFAPIAIRVKGHTAPYVVFGAGYDTCEDDDDPNTACASVTKGRGIVVMNAQSGPAVAADYRFIDPGTGAGRFVADVTAVDINGDGYIDVLYAAERVVCLARYASPVLPRSARHGRQD